MQPLSDTLTMHFLIHHYIIILIVQ